MLTEQLKRKLVNARKKPQTYKITLCPYCNEPVHETDKHAEYVKTKHSEHYFHYGCLAAAIKKETGGMIYG